MADEQITLDDLKGRQKRETKELQAKIQSLKHSVPKGDKKRKKEISAEIASLEVELKQKHMLEIENFQKNNIEPEQATEVAGSEQETHKNEPRLTKAQKRRNKKDALEKERQQRIAAAEEENVNCPRNVELRTLENQLKAFGLEIAEVNPDGNCLFKAITDQLVHYTDNLTVNGLRKLAADYMRQHKDAFLPFLVNPVSGATYTEVEFQKYCDDMQETNAWGGHAEIRAISQVLKRPIEIYQADTPVIKVGEDYDKEAVLLSYHKFEYGLGEHYNTVKKQSLQPEDSFERS